MFVASGLADADGRRLAATMLDETIVCSTEALKQVSGDAMPALGDVLLAVDAVVLGVAGDPAHAGIVHDLREAATPCVLGANVRAGLPYPPGGLR